MAYGEPKILYLNKMTSEKSGVECENVHIMFDDGSMVRIQVEMDQSLAADTQQGAQLLLSQILEFIEQMPKSEQEIAPICLGDTTCMYCGGKGCVNCRRK